MPIKGNCVNIVSMRFDFGVPLEDIFPPNDIHPRLQHLFEEAYNLFMKNRLSIEPFVRRLQGSLETRFKLKHRLIYDVHYNIAADSIEDAPGAYFWVIRHFLGLLPIPLLPTYSREFRFDWVHLSVECKHFLQHYESEHDKKHNLDYALAENINLLPFEHFLLLTILIHFIRKLSRKTACGRQVNRKTLQFLCKYFCDSLFIRPYMPGYKDGKMFPLFFYLVLRWRVIEKHCRKIGHSAYFLQNMCTSSEYHTIFKNTDYSQPTRYFLPKVIPVYKSVPYFCDNNNYLKDTSCQTDRTCSVDRGIQNSDPAIVQQPSDVELKREEISDRESSCIYPSPTDTDDGKGFDLKATSSPINRSGILCNNAEFRFLSNEAVTEQPGWSDVVRETDCTLKKVEEYIYDDYDTFSKETYNQISDGSKSKGSLANKVSKVGWTYTPQNSARERNREKNSKTELDNTYIRFEDVFDQNGKYKTNGCDSEEIKDENVAINGRSELKTPLFLDSSVKSSKETDENEGRRRKSFNLKRFKLKLDFLRVLTPKKKTCSSPSYDSITSNVKYQKIKNVKCYTL